MVTLFSLFIHCLNFLRLLLQYTVGRSMDFYITWTCKLSVSCRSVRHDQAIGCLSPVKTNLVESMLLSAMSIKLGSSDLPSLLFKFSPILVLTEVSIYARCVLVIVSESLRPACHEQHLRIGFTSVLARIRLTSYSMNHAEQMRGCWM